MKYVFFEVFTYTVSHDAMSFIDKGMFIYYSLYIVYALLYIENVFNVV